MRITKKKKRKNSVYCEVTTFLGSYHVYSTVQELVRPLLCVVTCVYFYCGQACLYRGRMADRLALLKQEAA